MFKKFLVPLDGSDESERIGGWACGLARGLGAGITLLAVVDPDELSLPVSEPDRGATGGRGGPGEGPYDRGPVEMAGGSASSGTPMTPVHGGRAGQASAFGTQVVEDAVERARRYLASEARRVEIDGGDAEVEVAIGKPAEEIVRAAERVGADLIAMATRRESALARGILGSVTDRVIHTSPVPVLAVHPESSASFKGNAGAPSTVIVPLDGSPLSESAVPVATSIAEAVGAEMLFLRAMATPYYGTAEAGMEYIPATYGMGELRQEMLAYLEDFVQAARQRGLKAESRAVTGTAAGAIIDAANDAEGALVVMSTHGHSGFKRFFLGSVTDKVVRSSGQPVLVLPSTE